MSTLKQRRANDNKTTKEITFSDENNSDWASYGFGLIGWIKNIVILSLFGFGMLYSIKHLKYDTFLPTKLTQLPYNPSRTTPFSKSIPYVPYTSVNPNLGETLSQIIAASMAQVRSIMLLLFNSLGHLNETNKINIYDYLLFSMSILIVPVMALVLPWVGTIGGVLQWWNIKNDIFIKIGSFLLLGLILFGTHVYQYMYVFAFIGFALYQMNQDKMVGFYLNQMKHFIYILVMFAVIAPAFGTLWYPFIIGMVGAAAIPYIPTLIGLLF